VQGPIRASVLSPVEKGLRTGHENSGAAYPRSNGLAFTYHHSKSACRRATAAVYA